MFINLRSFSLIESGLDPGIWDLWVSEPGFESGHVGHGRCLSNSLDQFFWLEFG